MCEAVAIREAVINAMVHNDYTREIPPKFKIFPDRLEITSYGGLFEGMSKDDFFSGLSLPKNKKLMQIFKDLDMVEQQGSRMPLILRIYPKDCFVFGDSFTRMIFPFKSSLSVTKQVSEQVKRLIFKIETGEYSNNELMKNIELKHRPTFLYQYLQPALNLKLIEMTIPEKPNSSKQKYRLTELGKSYIKKKIKTNWLFKSIRPVLSQGIITSIKYFYLIHY